MIGCGVYDWRPGGPLTVGPEEGGREEGVVHQCGERDHAHQVVRLKAQPVERQAAQLLTGNSLDSTSCLNIV